MREALARRAPGPVADVAAITIAATLGTAPLMAMHFGQVSLAALPANLLAAVAVAPVMWLGMLAAAAAQVDPVLATPFTVAAAPLLAFVEWIAHTMARAPAASIPVRLGSPIGLALTYAVLGGTIIAARAAWRRASGWRTRGDPWIRPPRTAVAVVVAIPAGLALFAAAVETGSVDPPARGELLVSFLNVGQGDATLLRRDGVAVLVDTGPPDGPILERLAEAGVRRLDALVLTHAQSDHEGAALSILRRVPTRLVVNGGAGWTTPVQRALPAATPGPPDRRPRRPGAQVRWHDDAAALATAARAVLPPEGDPNDRALVALVESGDFDLLLPADAESDVTAAIPLPDVDALKVAHHGSDDPGLPALLERIRPEFAAIEVGAREHLRPPDGVDARRRSRSSTTSTAPTATAASTCA